MELPVAQYIYCQCQWHLKSTSKISAQTDVCTTSGWSTVCV